MKHAHIILLVLIGLGWTSGLQAQDATVPSSEDIVKALVPNTGPQTRSLKGIELVPGQQSAAPSINLTVNFAYDSAKLETDTLLTMRRLGTALHDPRLARYKFLIAGHTDGKGGDAYNQHLSEARANAVRDHLVFFYDIPPDHISATGYGATQLIDPTHPEAPINRRVQITNVGSE